MSKDNIPTYDSATRAASDGLKYPAIAEIGVSEYFFVKCPNYLAKHKLSKYLYRYGLMHDKKFSWRTQNGPLVRVTRTA